MNNDPPLYFWFDAEIYYDGADAEPAEKADRWLAQPWITVTPPVCPQDGERRHIHSSHELQGWCIP